MAIPKLSPLPTRLARIGIFFRAGPRFEPPAHPGISHVLRASAGLTTQNSTIFAITRNIELAGASFNVHGDRENILYDLQCLRENLSDVLPYVCDTISRPAFKPWELVDYVHKRVEYDIEAHKSNQYSVLVEALHKAAYRGGLAHSLYCPEHQIKNIKREHLLQYVNNNLVPSRIKVISSGVEDLDLQREIEKSIETSHTYNGVDGATRYVGGEVRVQAPFSKTMVALVGLTMGQQDERQSLALKLYESVIGAYGAPIKYSAGTESSLTAAVQKGISEKVIAKTLNISHSDAGLFGVTLLADNSCIGPAVKRALTHLSSQAKQISEEQLNAARVKAYLQSEGPEKVFDNIKVSDITSAVDKVCSKLSIASVGNPRYVPYLDELV